MKKILVFLCGILLCGAIRADDFNVYWYMDGESYAQTSCSTGDDIILPTAPTKRGYTFNGWKKAFTTIEYLENTGTQWIDTEIIPNKNTKFRVKLNMSAYTGNVIIGYRSGGNEYRLFNYNGLIYFDYGNDGSGRIYGSKFQNNTTYDFLVGAKYVKNYETGITLLGRVQDIDLDANYNTIKINTATGKIFLLQIWDNDTLVRDFIPVLDLNNTPCMFDKVTERYFYNAGTGQFIPGPEVTE